MDPGSGTRSRTIGVCGTSISSGLGATPNQIFSLHPCVPLTSVLSLARSMKKVGFVRSEVFLDGYDDDHNYRHNVEPQACGHLLIKRPVLILHILHPRLIAPWPNPGLSVTFPFEPLPGRLGSGGQG